eukprot:4021483-Amphidinium_carterae.1
MMRRVAQHAPCRQAATTQHLSTAFSKSRPNAACKVTPHLPQPYANPKPFAKPPLCPKVTSNY